MFIQRELEQNGLDKELIENLLAPYNEQWLAMAIVQVEKKVRMPRPSDHLSLHRSCARQKRAFSHPMTVKTRHYLLWVMVKPTIGPPETSSARHGIRSKRSARVLRGF